MSGAEFIPQTEDDRKLKSFAQELSDALQLAIGPWVERTILARAAQPDSTAACLPNTLIVAAAEAASTATTEIGCQIDRLLKADIDEQWTTPLALARGAVPLITDVLRQHGVEASVRDADAIRINPTDVFDVTPASFAAIDPALQMLGIQWGAAKSHIFLSRRAQT